MYWSDNINAVMCNWGTNFQFLRSITNLFPFYPQKRFVAVSDQNLTRFPTNLSRQHWLYTRVQCKIYYPLRPNRTTYLICVISVGWSKVCYSLPQKIWTGWQFEDYGSTKYFASTMIGWLTRLIVNGFSLSSNNVYNRSWRPILKICSSIWCEMTMK